MPSEDMTLLEWLKQTYRKQSDLKSLPVSEIYERIFPQSRGSAGTTAADAIRGAFSDPEFKGFMIRNEHASQTLYFDIDRDANTSTGIMLKPGDPALFMPVKVKERISVIGSGSDTTYQVVYFYG